MIQDFGEEDQDERNKRKLKNINKISGGMDDDELDMGDENDDSSIESLDQDGKIITNHEKK